MAPLAHSRADRLWLKQARALIHLTSPNYEISLCSHMLISLQSDLYHYQATEVDRKMKSVPTVPAICLQRSQSLLGDEFGFWSLYMLSVVNGRERSTESGQYLWATE